MLVPSDDSGHKTITQTSLHYDNTTTTIYILYALLLLL